MSSATQRREPLPLPASLCAIVLAVLFLSCSALARAGDGGDCERVFDEFESGLGRLEASVTGSSPLPVDERDALVDALRESLKRHGYLCFDYFRRGRELAGRFERAVEEAGVPPPPAPPAPPDLPRPEATPGTVRSPAAGVEEQQEVEDKPIPRWILVERGGFLLSIAATLVPVGVGLGVKLGIDDWRLSDESFIGSHVLFGLGIILGPSVGWWIRGGDRVKIGLLTAVGRALGAAIAVGGFFWFDRSILVDEEEGTEPSFVGPITVMVLGGLLTASLVIFDLAAQIKVKGHGDEPSRWGVAPLLLPDGKGRVAAGAGLVGRF